MKKLMLLLIMVLIALSVNAVINTEEELCGYRGVVEHREGEPWLITPYDMDLRLLLAPQSILDTLGLVLNDGDSLYIEGIVQKDLFLVGKLWIESKGAALYWLRDFEHGDIYPGGATYQVNPKKCIACKLCIPNCPTGAISIVKGKAHIDAEKCTECGICIKGHDKFKGCPVGAISPR